MGARESLNGQENMARRKVKNGKKSPWGQCRTRPVPNCRCRSLVPENFGVFLPNHKAEWRRPFVPYFPTCLDFPSPPLSAHGSPRMCDPWFNLLDCHFISSDACDFCFIGNTHTEDQPQIS